MALVAVFTGCGGQTAPLTPVPLSDGAAAPWTPIPPAPTLPTTPIAGFDDGRAALGPILWAVALDPITGGPLEPVSTVSADAPRFWAAIPLLRAEPGLRLRAEWSYNDTPMPALAAETVVPNGDAGYVLFDLGLPPGERWPVGDYSVAIRVDGERVLSSSVQVVPAAP